ncbi:hypothetical protein ACFUAE_33440, partial [Streptomyces ardesiacus]
HSPYWWLKCAFGVDNDKALPVRAYHKLLVWDIMKKPAAAGCKAPGGPAEAVRAPSGPGLPGPLWEGAQRPFSGLRLGGGSRW